MLNHCSPQAICWYTTLDNNVANWAFARFTCTCFIRNKINATAKQIEGTNEYSFKLCQSRLIRRDEISCHSMYKEKKICPKQELSTQEAFQAHSLRSRPHPDTEFISLPRLQRILVGTLPPSQYVLPPPVAIT